MYEIAYKNRPGVVALCIQLGRDGTPEARA